MLQFIFKAIRYLERVSSNLQGKGWGGGSVVQEFSCVSSLLKGNEVKLCIDIGGNVGTYSSEILKRHPKCELIIFEPSAKNASPI